MTQMTQMNQMTQMRQIAAVLLVLACSGSAAAQRVLIEVMELYGVEVPRNDLEAAFDNGLAPTVRLPPGSFATPVGMLEVGTGRDLIDAAYSFGILAGRSAKGASPGELAAASKALLQMIGSTDRRTRVAGARVAGRVLAASFDPRGVRPPVPAGLTDGLFALMNQSHELEQLAAMDALGLIRETNAVPALIERYHFYREDGRRRLAGGALEALARIGDVSALELVKLVAADPWGQGRDATALAVAFARERLLQDGSLSTIQQAARERSRGAQARGYLDELGSPAP